MNTQREASERNWASDNTLEHINAGYLQRIADACEKMCLDREKLERDYKYMRENRDYYRRLSESQKRSAASLKGVITKLKKKLEGSLIEGEE